VFMPSSMSGLLSRLLFHGQEVRNESLRFIASARSLSSVGKRVGVFLLVGSSIDAILLEIAEEAVQLEAGRTTLRDIITAAREAALQQQSGYLAPLSQ
jgi:hypothetical protein